jgi:hypothetical protein
MMKQNYLNLVRQTDNAEVLSGLHHDAMNDASLHGPDKDEIATAVQNKFAALNAGNFQRKDAKTQRSHFFKKAAVIFLLALAAGLMSIAPARSTETLVTVTTRTGSALEQSPVATGDSAISSRRLAALSQVETGDNDRAQGKAGEVSRFQIMPAVWRAYASFTITNQDGQRVTMQLDPTDYFAARQVATRILQDRCKAFEKHFHQPPDNYDFYLLWARPAWPLEGKVCFDTNVQDRALRFHNLCASAPLR